MKTHRNLIYSGLVLIAIVVSFGMPTITSLSNTIVASTTCVDLNGDGDTDDFGECITIEDEG